MRYIITFLLFCFFCYTSTECAETRLCVLDEKGNVKGDSRAPCCRKKNGDVVNNPSARNKKVICCGKVKGDDSYSSLVSRAHGLNNEIVSKQKEITRLENEHNNVNKRNRDGKLTDDQALQEHDKIDAKIKKLNDDIGKRRTKMEGYLERAQADGLKEQVQGIEHLKHLTNLPGKLTGTNCIRGNGKGCL